MTSGLRLAKSHRASTRAITAWLFAAMSMLSKFGVRARTKLS